MDRRFNKHEKLKSKKLINKLFTEGQTVSAYPLRLVYLPTSLNEANTPVKTGVSVSKRYFKKAVQRIRIKRLMREAYRLNKSTYFNNLTTPHAFMILYIGNKKPTYLQMEQAMNKLFNKFINATHKATSDEKNT
ncbi:ribonuclease P protein component [Bizionia sediminis]|uniref:Ribonuclease P protein component n=1 Tax=Bizionia sediminis TaxID=1737064 RepID=A0ABW5KR49_9FLAO